MGRTFTSALLIAISTSCTSSTSPTPWDGQVRVSGRIFEFKTDAAIAGARVSIDGVTATTDASGSYALSVPSGEHTVMVDGTTIAIVVRMFEPNYRGDYYVNPSACSGRYGMVIDKVTRGPVAGATIRTVITTSTDDTGWFKLNFGCAPCLPGNTTGASVTHPKYVDGSFSVGRGVCGMSRNDVELQPR